MDDFDSYIRIALIGDEKTGKSNFMHRFCHNQKGEISTYHPTGIMKDSKIVSSSKQRVKVNLLEIGSQFQRHPNETVKIQGTYFMYSLSNAFLLFYSNQSSGSLASIKKQLELVRRHSSDKPIFLGKDNCTSCIPKKRHFWGKWDSINLEFNQIFRESRRFNCLNTLVPTYF